VFSLRDDVCILCCVWRHDFTMGWRWLVGSFKLQVPFVKEPYKRDDILQKRSIILTSRTHLYLRDRTDSRAANQCVRHDSFTRVTHLALKGWLWLVGSLKLQVIFVKEPYKRDDILQKRPIILRSLLTVATPYRVAKTHRMFYLYRSFSAKEPYNLWLFCRKWPAT